MEKLLKILGRCFPAVIILSGGILVCGLVIGAIAAYAHFNGPGLDSESKEYVDKTIPILVNDWNPDELRSRASQELLPYLKDPDIGNLYSIFRKLGRLTRYHGSKGESHINFNFPRGKIVTASYIATADFENGDGTIRISLIKKDDVWKIFEFRINSPELMKR